MLNCTGVICNSVCMSFFVVEFRILALPIFERSKLHKKYMAAESGMILGFVSTWHGSIGPGLPDVLLPQQSPFFRGRCKDGFQSILSAISLYSRQGRLNSSLHTSLRWWDSWCPVSTAVGFSISADSPSSAIWSNFWRIATLIMKMHGVWWRIETNVPWDYYINLSKCGEVWIDMDHWIWVAAVRKYPCDSVKVANVATSSKSSCKEHAGVRRQGLRFGFPFRSMNHLGRSRQSQKRQFSLILTLQEGT